MSALNGKVCFLTLDTLFYMINIKYCLIFVIKNNDNYVVFLSKLIFFHRCFSLVMQVYQQKKPPVLMGLEAFQYLIQVVDKTSFVSLIRPNLVPPLTFVDF